MRRSLLSLVRPALLAGILLGIPIRAMAEFRIWTTPDNRRVEAEFAGIEAGQVKLRVRGGSMGALPLDKLNAVDRAWVAAHSGNAAAPAVPTAPTPLSPPRSGFPGAASGGDVKNAWPKSTGLDAPPNATAIKEDVAAKEFIYRTAHFEFRCDAKLGADVVREFGRIFEGTLTVNSELPLALNPKPEDGNEFFVAQLFTDTEDYFRAGAIPGSAGVYMGGKKSIFVPLASLGVKAVGKRFMLEQRAENTTLIHEITHQMMNHWIRKLPEWYVEGSAEYVAAQKYHMGRFSLTGPGANVRKYLHDHKGVWEKKFTMWHLNYLMHVGNRQWNAAVGGAKPESMRNYASATILTYYFYHVDGKGDAANIIAWLRAIESGTPEKQATADHLIRGRSFQDMEKEVSKAMMKEQLALDFTGDGPANSE